MKKRILAPTSINDVQAYEQFSRKMQEEGWTITKVGTIFVALEKCDDSAECKQPVPVEELIWDKTDGRKAPGLRTEMFNNVVQLICWPLMFFNLISQMDYSQWVMTIGADATANLISDFRVNWYRTVRIIMPLFCLAVCVLNMAYVIVESFLF